jgi:hypothetical protein
LARFFRQKALERRVNAGVCQSFSYRRLAMNALSIPRLIGRSSEIATFTLATVTRVIR